jgi:hypothetical protein
MNLISIKNLNKSLNVKNRDMHNINNEIQNDIIIMKLKQQQKRKRKKRSRNERNRGRERKAHSHGKRCYRLSAKARRTVKSWLALLAFFVSD